MRNNGINENAILINRGAVIMKIKYWKRNMMYNLAQRVNGQSLDIVEFSLYHYDLIYFMEVNHKGKLSFLVLQHLAVEAY